MYLKELEERKELLTIKRDKYRKQLEFLNKQISETENKLKETLIQVWINSIKVNTT